MQFLGQIVYYSTLAVLGIESLTYTGFLEKHTRLSIWYLLVAIAILSKVIPWEKINKQIKDWYLYIFISGWFTLIIVESVKYPNFIYSHFHINLESTGFFVIFLLWPKIMKYLSWQIIFIIISCFLSSLNKIMKYLSMQSIFIILSCCLSFFYMVQTLPKTLYSGLQKNKYEITHLNKTYDEKMAEEYGPSYYYYKFVAENTSNAATIIVPPQMAPWNKTGNVGLSKYFLGTRILINGSLDSTPNLKNVDYIMISSETENRSSLYRLWPEFNISTKEVIAFNTETGVVSRLSSFDPIYFSQNRLWGLIKVSK